MIGIHNYQTQNSKQWLSPDHALVARHNCQPLMFGQIAAWATVWPGLEGKPVAYSPAGTGAQQRKYATGPYSAEADNAAADMFGAGTASCPDVDTYRTWCQQVHDSYGHNISHWEVWNEADDPTFFRGTPTDLIELTFAAHGVWGAKTIAPSLTVLTWADSGTVKVGGGFLTRAEFADQYYAGLVAYATALGVPLPVTAATVHGYGGGATVAAAAATRLQFLTAFKNRIADAGLAHLSLWDTEWNLRNNVSGGFADTAGNAAIWKQSYEDVAALGYDRQYAFLWEDDAATEGFQATQLQMHPGTTHINGAYRTLTFDPITPPPPPPPPDEEPDVTLENAKSRVARGGGEPAEGWLSPSDFSAAFDDLQDAWQTDDAAITKASLGLGNVNNTSDLNKPISTATQEALNNIEAGVGSNQGVFIEDFAGATDQDKLNAALIYCASQTYRPPILFKAKNYSFSAINVFDGLRLIGTPGAASNADRAGAEGAVGTRITCTGSGTWLIPTVDQKAGQSWDVSVENIAFTGNTNLTWLTSSSVVLWCWHISNVTFNAFRSVIGSAATKLLINACWFTGFWQINNSSQTAIHIGGSDNSLWTEGMLLDSNPATTPGNDAYHMKLAWLAKSTIGGSGMVYITCDEDWGGVEITGNSTDGPLFMQNIVAEGRNVNSPGTVGCIRQESGWTHIDNVWASFCQANPIQMAGGLLIIKRGAYKPCAASPPGQWVHHTGGTLNITTCYASGITEPVVNTSGGSLVADSTITVI